MESNWRLNMWYYGMTNYFVGGGAGNQSGFMCARRLTGPAELITNFAGVGLAVFVVPLGLDDRPIYANGFIRPAIGGKTTFPHGYPVGPDQPP